MSQITTCPSCGTRFRVVADQLRISDGWVRCGQCQEVFDARNYLDAISRVAPVPPAPSPEPAPTPTSVSSAAATAAAMAPPPASAVAPSPSVAAPPAAPVPAPVLARPPIPMIPVPAPRAPEAPTTPGYELPAPTWEDDFDFASYHAGGSVSAEPRVDDQAHSVDRGLPAAGVEPAGDSAVAASVPAKANVPTRVPTDEGLAEPDRASAALSAPSEEMAANAPAVPQENAWTMSDVESSALSTPAARMEPVWASESSVRSAPSEFPSLDVSVLPQPTYTPPAVDVDVNANPPNLDQHDKLLKEERPFAQEAAPLGAVPLAVAPDASMPASPDALEAAAQKLAQAEQPSVGVDAAVGAAAPAPFPFAPQAEEDPLVLDSVLEPGFVRDARRKAWWQKPLVRVAMGAGVVVLPVALVLQIALHERNALAAWKPDLRPGLEFMCTALQCTLGPRQKAGAMVVSGSSFAKGDMDRSYLLNLSIQNRANTPVGVPAVELTLTDAQDQAIARKVIAAKDLGAPQELAAGAEWSGAVPVTTQGLNLQVVGYRVLLFYP